MRLPLALALLALLSAPRAARACATCGSGDPTLTTMGLGQPFAGRARFGLRLRYRWDRVIDGARGVELHEGRADVSAAYSPWDRLTLAVTVPMTVRRARWASLRAYTTAGPGDLDLRARVVLLRDRAFAPSHLLGAVAGVALPTSVDQVDGQGARLPVDVQNGAGAIAPSLGLTYAHLADPLAVFASAVVTLPFAGRFDEAPGPSLRGSVAVQWRLARWITLRAGLDARWDAPARVGDATDPRSEHATLFLAPDVLLAPDPDWVVGFGVRAPLVQASAQGRDEGWMFLASLTVDA